MRSVFVFMSDVDLGEVRAWLDRAATQIGIDSWRWPQEGDGVLFPGLVKNLDDFDCEELESARIALEKEVEVIVQIDVTGRRQGNVEVEEFLGEIMTTFSAVAQDDHTAHSWTLEELRSGAQVQGHGFFDTQGWYEEGN